MASTGRLPRVRSQPEKKHRDVEGTTRFDYARLAPYADVFRTATLADQRASYRACIARNGRWTCHDFKATESTTDALRNAFVQLGE